MCVRLYRPACNPSVKYIWGRRRYLSGNIRVLYGIGEQNIKYFETFSVIGKF